MALIDPLTRLEPGTAVTDVELEFVGGRLLVLV